MSGQAIASGESCNPGGDVQQRADKINFQAEAWKALETSLVSQERDILQRTSLRDQATG